MASFQCPRCGTEFDPQRDGGSRHADTARCPQCGAEHDAAREFLDAVEGDETTVGVETDVADLAGGPVVTNAEAIQTADGLRLTVDVALGNGNGGDA